MVTRIVPAVGIKNTLGAILLYNQQKNELSLVSTHPRWAFGKQHEREVRSLSTPPQGKIGITGRCALQNKVQYVGDVTADADYLTYNEKTKSELDVPIREGDHVLGVLSLECEKVNGFDNEAEEAMLQFAELAAFAIQNTRRLRQLRETQEESSKMKALAWVGSVSATWRHSIGNKATTIKEISKHIQKDLVKGEPEEKIRARLEKVYHIVEEIKRVPFPPLSAEEGVVNFPICPLVRDRINMFRGKKGRYGDIEYEMDFEQMDELTLVRADPEHIRRILDNLLDNAAEAMKTSKVKNISVTLTLEGEGIAILVTDTGRGISIKKKQYVLKRPIFKKRNESGSGIGLYLANSIIEVYKGRLEIRSTGRAGTTMALWLPIQK